MISTERRREACVLHFARRCAERGIAIDAEALARTIRTMAPCWRQPGQNRYRLKVRRSRRQAVIVIWDAALDAPVTAYWPWGPPACAAIPEAARGSRRREGAADG